MFIINSLNDLEPLSIYLVDANEKVICCLDEGIDEKSASLSIGLNQQYELNFTINSRIFDETSESLINTPGYDMLVEGMYLAVERVGFFKMKNPELESDGTIESKIITAKSCDCELEGKILKVELNMGLETSQEYLVTYDEDETEPLLNEYTGIPFDWIVLYNTYPQQLRRLKNEYDSGYYGTPNTSFTVTDPTKVEKLESMLSLITRLKFKLTTDSEGEISRKEYVVYQKGENDDSMFISLDAEFGSRVNELITFYDKYHKQLSIIDIILEQMDDTWSVGTIYGMDDGDYSLCNKKYQFDTDESIYSFLTQTLATTIECVVDFDIIHRKINIIPADKIGNDTGIFLSFETLVNSVGASCDESDLTTRLYVNGANDLDIRMVNFGEPFVEDLTYKMNARNNDGRRIYVTDELAEKYDDYIKFREAQRLNFIELSRQYNQYLVDIDELKYRVPADSLKTNWGTFKMDLLQQAFTTYNNLLAALITMYKHDYPDGVNDDDSVKESYIRKTEYWYDYKAYQDTIVQIRAAIETYPNYSNKTKWTDEQKALYEDAIKAYETEWSLYGSEELQVKITGYNDKIETLLENNLVYKVSQDSDEIKTWDELSELERMECGSIEPTYMDSYDMYNEYLTNRNSAQAYLDTLLEEIGDLETEQSQIQTQRNAIKTGVDRKNNFTADELKVLNHLYRDSEYTNEYILTTSLDTAVTAVDVQNELYQDGVDKVALLSRPQIVFETEIENLLGLPDFKAMWSQFKLGNYMLVEYRDGTYTKVRLTGFEFNPLIPTNKDLTVEFSNFVVSKSRRYDTLNLLNLAATDGISAYSNSRGGNGNGDIDDTISNTMLAKLLNSELFGTRVSNVVLDTMVLNSLTAKTAIFGGLSKGETIVDGRCIQTGWIVDATYNGNKDSGSIANTKGSIINLVDGKFNLGGGRLIFDGNDLYMSGKLSWENITNKDDVVTKDYFTEEIGKFVDKVTEDLQAQIDGNITTWFYDYEPTTDNFPASEWTTDELKNQHLGDLFYIVNSDGKDGLCYRYALVDGSYTWVLVEDAELAKALADAARAQDTADCKRRVFVDTPYPPYDIGDLWVQGEGGDLMRCIDAKLSNESYEVDDWILATKYTDDTALNAFINEVFEQKVNYILEQADKKSETWYQSSDPSTAWTTPEDKAKHKGDLWYDTNNEKTYIFNGTDWEESKSTPPDDVFDKIDGKASIFMAQPTPPYNVGDLWFNGKEILSCVTARESGSFVAADWQKRHSYTDDSSLIDFIDNTYTNKINYIEGQLDGKIETFVQSSDPSTAWTTPEDKAKHKGDLWYDTNEEKTYIFNGSGWDEVKADVPKELLDKVDGKAQIFTTQPVPPYDVGDLWVQGATGDIMKCKTARASGSYVASDWDKASKYTDDSKVDSIITDYNKLKEILGYNGTTITGTYMYSPNIIGGYLAIGNAASGVMAQITSDGKLTATGVEIQGTIYAENGSFTGNIYAATGTIAGFKFSNRLEDSIHAYENTLYRTIKNVKETEDGVDKYYDYQGGLKGESSGNKATEAIFYVRKKLSSEASWANSTLPFYVRNNGYMFCKDLSIGDSLYMTVSELSFTPDDDIVYTDKRVKTMSGGADSVEFGILSGSTTADVSVGTEEIRFSFGTRTPLCVCKDTSTQYYLYPSSTDITVDLGSIYNSFDTLYIRKIVFTGDDSSMTTAPKSGSGTTTDYNALNNKPLINNVELSGSLTLAALGIAARTHSHNNYLPAKLSGSNYVLNANTLQIPNKKGYNVSDYSGAIVTGIYMDDYGTSAVANNRFIVGAVNHPTVLRGTELRVWDSDLGKNTDGTYNYVTLADYISSHSSGGTTNYNSLTNRPQINGTTLSGNVSLSTLGIAAVGHSHSGYALSGHNHDSDYVSSVYVSGNYLYVDGTSYTLPSGGGGSTAHTHSYSDISWALPNSHANNSGHMHRCIGNSGGYGLWINSSNMIYGSTSVQSGSTSNGQIILGGASYRFKEIWCTNSLNSTSDKNLKTNINPFDERYESAFMEFQPCTYMLKNFTEKDNHDRVHFGLIAQDVENALSNHNISVKEAAFLCIDELESPNAAGETTEYSLRYGELTALNMHMTQKAHRRITELESEIKEFKKTIKLLQAGA